MANFPNFLTNGSLTSTEQSGRAPVGVKIKAKKSPHNETKGDHIQVLSEFYTDINCGKACYFNMVKKIFFSLREEFLISGLYPIISVKSKDN